MPVVLHGLGGDRRTAMGTHLGLDHFLAAGVRDGLPPFAIAFDGFPDSAGPWVGISSPDLGAAGTSYDLAARTTTSYDLPRDVIRPGCPDHHFV